MLLVCIPDIVQVASALSRTKIIGYLKETVNLQKICIFCLVLNMVLAETDQNAK